MPAKPLPILSQLQLCFDAVEELEPMNELVDKQADESLDVSKLFAAVIPTLLECAPSVPLVSNVIHYSDAPLQRGSTALLLQRHAHKQAQGLAPLTKREKLPKSADDKPLSVLAVAMREVPPDKLLQQAQDAQDFPAACRRLRQACSHWAKDIQKEAADEKRNLTAGERKGVAFWQCEANQAGQALAIFDACNGDKRAAVDALDNADMERFAVALRTGCYVTLGL